MVIFHSHVHVLMGDNIIPLPQDYDPFALPRRTKILNSRPKICSVDFPMIFRYRIPVDIIPYVYTYIYIYIYAFYTYTYIYIHICYPPKTYLLCSRCCVFLNALSSFLSCHLLQHCIRKVSTNCTSR